MTEAVETEGIEIVVGKVEFEAAPEILDALLEFVPAQVGQRGGHLFGFPKAISRVGGSFRLSRCVHGENLRKATLVCRGAGLLPMLFATGRMCDIG